jgi:catechol 2,3-dioxygenase-like lactoylglutathione lyase family enzyme
MTQPAISGVSPFFIVADVPATLAFYRDKLGFEITYRGRSPEDEFFGIVRRDGAMIMFKALGEIVDGKDVHVDPVPNYGRQPAFSWDAYVPRETSREASSASWRTRSSSAQGRRQRRRRHSIDSFEVSREVALVEKPRNRSSLGDRRA